VRPRNHVLDGIRCMYNDDYNNGYNNNNNNNNNNNALVLLKNS